MENGAHMDKKVVSFIENVLFTTLTNVNFDVDAHLALLRESQRIKEQVREMALAVMKKLDEANTTIYGNPYPHKVDVTIKKGAFIIVSGHDLKDLEMLLELTKERASTFTRTVRCCPATAMRG